LSGVTGLLLPPADEAAWEKAILKMARSDTHKVMGKCANEFVEAHFSTHVIADDFLLTLTSERAPLSVNQRKSSTAAS
jgi:glycosyltransferase involved in cell wall biosynthesis